MKRFLFLLAAVWLLAFPRNIRGDYTAVVSPGSVIVTNFQGWGTSLCWWANVVGAYSNRNAYMDLAFSQLKLNIVRYNIGGGENPSLNLITSYRANMQGFEPTNGVWNWNADLSQRWVLQAALARGANLVDAFANSPPWWMTVSGSVTGAVGGTNNLQTSYQNTFATYLATVVSNLTILDGVHFNYVTPMNEPSGGWAYDKQQQEGCHMSTAQQAPVITALRTALNAGLPSAGIDAPEDVDPEQSVTDLNSYSSTTLNSIALCTTHTYGATGSSSLASKVSAIGKNLWVSEYGDSDGTGLTMARRIQVVITQMGVRAWIYWQVVDSATGWGFLSNPLTSNYPGGFTTNYTINEKFYVMGQFSEFIRPGCRIISVNDTNTLAAYTPSNSTLVLVAINTNITNFNITYDLTAFGSVPWQISGTQTSPGENMATLAPLAVVSSKFTAAISAQSVTTFILTTNLTAPAIAGQSPVSPDNGLALYAGQAPAFSVSASGTPPLNYQWKSNGIAVSGAGSSALTLTSVQLANITNVICVVTNPAGSATSQVWIVSIIPKPTASYPVSVLAMNPIGYWRLNETPDNGTGNNGVICHDYVGGNNGVYSNAVLAQPGYSQLVEPTEHSAEFGVLQPTNCAVTQINCADFSLPAGSNGEFSVGAWVNGAGHIRQGNAGIATKGYFYGEELDLDEGAPGSCFRFSVRNAAGTAFSANSIVNAYTSSGWHHLVGVCDEANGNLLLYVDGVLSGSAAITPNSGITNSAGVPMTIGARATSLTSGNTQQFFGFINDVALYNYALSSNQVQTMYQAGASLPPVSLTLTTVDAAHLQCNWNYGVLQSATNILGPYQDQINATQPYTIAISNAAQLFYRVREN